MAIKNGANEFVSRTDKELQFTFMGVDLATKKVGMYSFYIPTTQPINGMTAGTYLKTDYATTFVKDVTGSIKGTVTGDQADPNIEMSLTWNDDYNHIQNNVRGFSRDILRGLMSGQVVTMSDGVRIAMLGTAGNYKTGDKSTANELNREWGNLLKPYWGFLIKDHAFNNAVDFEPAKEANCLISAYLKLSKPFMVESYYLSGKGTENCLMMPAVCQKMATMDEADVNTCNATLNVLCDTYERVNFYNRGFTQADYSTGVLNELSVDYIVEGDTADITSPVTDEVACVINVSTGAITIEKYNGSTWDVETGATFEANATIFAKSSIIDSTEVEGNCFATVKTPGAGLNGFASSFVLDTTNTVKNYVCLANVYEREEKKMIKLIS